MREPFISDQFIDPENELQLEDPSCFLEEAAEAMHIISSKGIIVWANKKELELVGYTQEEYIGHHISEFYSDRFVINDILCRLVYKQEVVNYPAELVRKDGSKVQVLLNSNAYMHNNDFIHSRTATRDITDLKLFQTRLENSNARVLNQLLISNTLIKMLTNTSWKTDYQGYVVSFQPKWGLYTGQAVEEQLQYNWLKAIHPDDRIALKANLISAIRDNRDLKQLARVYCQSYKDYVYCGIYATPCADLNARNYEWLFVLIDQTKVVPPDVLPLG